MSTDNPISQQLKRFRYRGKEDTQQTTPPVKEMPDLNDILNAVQASREENFKGFAEVGEKFATMSNKVDEIEIVSKRTADDVKIMQSRINDIEQEKFSAHMDIVGIDAELAARMRENTFELTKQIFDTLKINFNPQAIRKAFLRQITRANQTVFVLVLEFISVEEKLKIKQQKKLMKDARGTFFEDSMTPIIRDIYLAARRTAKSGGVRMAYLKRGRVFVTMHNGTEMRIHCKDDLIQLHGESFSKAGSFNNAGHTFSSSVNYNNHASSSHQSTQ